LNDRSGNSGTPGRRIALVAAWAWVMVALVAYLHQFATLVRPVLDLLG
jgi:hypothetical protein